MKIEIHSPKSMIVPGGKSNEDYKRKINISSFKDTGTDIILVFENPIETDRLVDFINLMTKTHKISGSYSLHFIEDSFWIHTKLIEKINDISLVFKNYKRFGGFAGGIIREI